jgi:hypothetical protein
MLHDLANLRTLGGMTTTTELSWKTWTDVNGVIGHMAHDHTNLCTYMRAGEHGTAMFPWSKFGEAGVAEGHSRAIAWGQSSQHIHADDPEAVAENLAWYSGALTCEHLVRRTMACDDCSDEAAEAERLATSEVIRLDIGVNATDYRQTHPVDAELGDKLAQLAAEYDEADAAAKAANERLDAIKTGIKATCQLLRPNAHSITVVSDDLEHNLSVSYGIRRTVDTKRLRALCEQAGVDYQSLTKPSGSWSLRRVK